MKHLHKTKLLFRFFYFLLWPCTAFSQTQKIPEPLVPQSVNDAWMKDYTKEEKERIDQDLNNIRALVFRGKTGNQSKPLYIATAGGPGSSKSTIFETILQRDEYKNYAYLDPDQRALRFMHTYLESVNLYEVSQRKTFQEVLESAYHKWRGGSNYIWNTLTNEAFAGKYHIALGSTSSSPFIEQHYKILKSQGYQIELVLCGSKDQNRVASLDHRAKEQGFIQIAEKDIMDKGRMFYERMPIYFQYADVLHIYWTEDFKKGSIKVATFDHGKKTVFDQKGLDSFAQDFKRVTGKDAVFK